MKNHFIKYLIALSSCLNFAHAASEHKENQYLFEKLNSEFVNYAKLLIPEDIKLNLFPNWDIIYPAASSERDSDYASSDSDKKRDAWDISVLGGYWRDPDYGHPMIHLIVLCHELGHHIGGPPYKLDDKGKFRWSSMEGQSDYYANRVCVPSFLKRNPSWLDEGYVVYKKIHSEIIDRCQREFRDKLSLQICKYSSQGALELSKIHVKFDHPKPKVPEVISPETPETKEAQVLERNSYPSNQCRFDSYFNGALALGRPRCWYPTR